MAARQRDGAVAAFRKNVSRETLQRLEIYEALLKRWNPTANLVAESTLPQLWSRHFLDSAQLLDHAAARSHWLDIGTGGGFPGMVMAVVAAETQPGSRFTLIEASARKCQFLRRVASETGAKIDLHEARAEELEPLRADMVTARAVAPLAKLLEISVRHLGSGGECVFPKGAGRFADIAAAESVWTFDLQETPSITEPESAILHIRRPRRGK